MTTPELHPRLICLLESTSLAEVLAPPSQALEESQPLLAQLLQALLQAQQRIPLLHPQVIAELLLAMKVLQPGSLVRAESLNSLLESSQEIRKPQAWVVHLLHLDLVWAPSLPLSPSLSPFLICLVYF